MTGEKITDWVKVHTASGPSEAIVVRSVLETNGINVREVRETAGKLWALTMDGLGKIDIYVPKEQFDEARELIESGE